MRTDSSAHPGSRGVREPSGSSSAKPRSIAMTAPPRLRGRSAAATAPTWRRPTVPSSASERTSPASMATHRSPPQAADQTGPSAWWATGPVTCSARTTSAGARETVVVRPRALVLGGVLLGLRLEQMCLAGHRRGGVAVRFPVDLLGAAEELLGLGLHLVEHAHGCILPQVSSHPPAKGGRTSTVAPGASVNARFRVEV